MSAAQTLAAVEFADQLRAATTAAEHSAVVRRLLTTAAPGVLMTVVEDQGCPIRLSALVGVTRNRLTNVTDPHHTPRQPLPRRRDTGKTSRYPRSSE